MGVINVEKARKSFGTGSEAKVILNDFSMNIKKGSIYALMGASGCGKTTLISCIVGTNQLDKGTIKVLDERVGKHNSKIGYMPQEISLINEFTIREILNFFGTIYGMSRKRVDERLEFLLEFLELNDEDRLIADCSGGQQRRVSFAVALIHEPEILILDEPTVGVDPLLRAKIWDHLVEITRTKNTSVMITTHYIEEARNSTHIALMRKGILLVEDTPLNLLTKCGTDSLEEAFLTLSENQERGQLTYQNPVYVETPSTRQSINKMKTKTPTLFASNKNKLRALITKNFIQTIRNPSFLLFSFLIPVIGMFGLHYAAGGTPKGLKFGIVNEEVNSYSECFNKTLKTAERIGEECLLDKISCRFINEIDDVIELKHYEDWDKAEADVRSGGLYGYIKFAHNFTEAFPVLTFYFDIDSSDDGLVQVFMDKSNFHIGALLEKNLYDVYHRFVAGLMRECNFSEKVGTIPMRTNTFHGTLTESFKHSLVPGFLTATFFGISSYLTALALIEDRRCGIWERALTAGAHPYQFIISHFVVGSLITILQAFEFSVYSIYFGNDCHQLSYYTLVVSFTILLGLTGTLYGLCISVLTDSVLNATFFSLVVNFPFVFISGIFWPLESAPSALVFIGKALPFTYPSRSLKNILFGDFQFSHPTIYMGFIVLGCWVVGQSLFCFWYARSSNLSKSKSDI